MERILMIILAILLPPVAVGIQRGLGTSLLLNVVLTLLAWLPGAIHALIVVLGAPGPARV
ncbi:MAG: YqaE/Pmp3 family membrane protein [Thermoanaerobaculia bacterium]|nr:YqaE/Pmp3 family membrane protein [Thermoanaerobaculia bacterium]